MIETKKVTGRRTLRFESLDDVLADAESVGPDARALGNWTPAQVVQHVARFLTGALDGFDFKAPLPLRLVGKLLKTRGFDGPIPPGFRLRGKMQVILPDPDATWDDSIGELRRGVERVRGGAARMTTESPLFGALTHEEWVQIHCRHAELHLGFLKKGQRD